MWSSWPCVSTSAAIRYCCSCRRSGITRSTPRSSGSGNITPASTRMAVSPQAMTIMFMPNSPTPPSGISSSGAAATCRSAVVRMRPQLAILTSKGRSRTKSSRGPGASDGRRQAPPVATHQDGCWDSLPGTVRIGLDYSTDQSSARTKNLRKPRQFCELQRLRPPARVDVGACERVARRPAQLLGKS